MGTQFRPQEVDRWHDSGTERGATNSLGKEARFFRESYAEAELEREAGICHIKNQRVALYTDIIAHAKIQAC